MAGKYNRYYPKQMWKVINDHFGDNEINEAVEIGTYLGHWAIGLLDNCKVGRLQCIDNAKKAAVRLMSASWNFKLKEYVNKKAFLIIGNSKNKSTMPVNIDLLYVDGGHSYKDVLQDLTLWYPKVNKGGLIICHDSNEVQTNKGILEFLNDRNLVYKEESLGPIGIPTIKSIWITK